MCAFLALGHVTSCSALHALSSLISWPGEEDDRALPHELEGPWVSESLIHPWIPEVFTICIIDKVYHANS